MLCHLTHPCYSYFRTTCSPILVISFMNPGRYTSTIDVNCVLSTPEQIQIFIYGQYSNFSLSFVTNMPSLPIVQLSFADHLSFYFNFFVDFLILREWLSGIFLVNASGIPCQHSCMNITRNCCHNSFSGGLVSMSPTTTTSISNLQ